MPQDYSIDSLTEQDQSRLEEQRAVVYGYVQGVDEEVKNSVQGKLSILNSILKSNVIDPSETYVLQSLGIVFGDAFAQQLECDWVMVNDEYGRDPALGFEGSTVLIYPLTMISKRVEDGEDFDVIELFSGVARLTLEQLAEEDPI
ncbi:MAG: DUF3806 domain-containing protein [Pseudomonadota bacterium]